MANNLVQHADFNVKPSDYKHLKEDELLVTSTFYTIQGEGPFAGRVVVFNRLAGCNLGIKAGPGCEFCDTFFKFAEGKIMTFKALADETELKAQGKTKLIVISGGEPMVQKNVVAYTKYLNERGFNVQFETNSLIYREIPKEHAGHTNHIICSPKMGGADKYPEIRPDVFDRADCLKFVTEQEGKFRDLPPYAFEFAKTGKPVYVSPINVYRREVDRGEIPCMFTEGLYDIDECRKNYQHAAKLCLEHGFILNIQTHLLVSLE